MLLLLGYMCLSLVLVALYSGVALSRSKDVAAEETLVFSPYFATLFFCSLEESSTLIMFYSFWVVFLRFYVPPLLVFQQCCLRACLVQWFCWCRRSAPPFFVFLFFSLLKEVCSSLPTFLRLSVVHLECVSSSLAVSALQLKRKMPCLGMLHRFSVLPYTHTGAMFFLKSKRPISVR